jgi:hypothetical protein
MKAKMKTAEHPFCPTLDGGSELLLVRGGMDGQVTLEHLHDLINRVRRGLVQTATSCENDGVDGVLWSFASVLETAEAIASALVNGEVYNARAEGEPAKNL